MNRYIIKPPVGGLAVHKLASGGTMQFIRTALRANVYGLAIAPDSEVRAVMVRMGSDNVVVHEGSPYVPTTPIPALTEISVRPMLPSTGVIRLVAAEACHEVGALPLHIAELNTSMYRGTLALGEEVVFCLEIPRGVSWTGPGTDLNMGGNARVSAFLQTPDTEGMYIEQGHVFVGNLDSGEVDFVQGTGLELKTNHRTTWRGDLTNAYYVRISNTHEDQTEAGTYTLRLQTGRWGADA